MESDSICCLHEQSVPDGWGVTVARLCWLAIGSGSQSRTHIWSGAVPGSYSLLGAVGRDSPTVAGESGSAALSFDLERHLVIVLPGYGWPKDLEVEKPADVAWLLDIGTPCVSSVSAGVAVLGSFVLVPPLVDMQLVAGE